MQGIILESPQSPDESYLRMMEADTVKLKDREQKKRGIFTSSKEYPFLKKPLEIKNQVWQKTVDPLVSINCVAYNHEQFIGEAIESFLGQKTSFKVEILLHDDASPDQTADIVKEYETNYPQLITATCRTQNQYDLGKRPEIYNINRSQGKYIALCDGDDYWTDVLKLEKQVAILEKNSRFSICVGAYKRLNPAANKKLKTVNHSEDKMEDGFSFSLKDMEYTYLTKSLTAVFRKAVIRDINLRQYNHFRDLHLFYHIVKNSYAFYFGDILGVYRIHEGGISSMKQGKVNKRAAYQCYKELYLHNKDEFTRKMSLRTTLGLLNFNIFNEYEGNTLKKNLRLFVEGASLIRTFTGIKMLIMVFLKREWKDKIKGSTKI